MRISAIPLRVQTISGEECFAFPDLNEILEQGRIHPDQDREDFYFYNFDPLTTELQPVLNGMSYSAIRAVEIVKVPVTCNFIVDAVDRFYSKRLSKYYVWSANEDELVAAEIWEAFSRFFDSNRDVMMTSDYSSGDVWRRSCFSELGLDFMRQHYRSLKSRCIKGRSAVAFPELQQLLFKTISHRTLDSHWGGNLVGEWERGIEMPEGNR